MLELPEGAPGAPDEHYPCRSHGLDARYVAGVLDLSVGPIGNNVPHLRCLVSGESPVAVAAQRVIEIEVDTHGRDVSPPGREHQAMTVVTASGRAKLGGCGDDEPMSLPRERDGTGRRITANAREDGRAITSMNGEARIDVRGHRGLANVAAIGCTRQGVTAEFTNEINGPNRSRHSLTKRGVGDARRARSGSGLQASDAWLLLSRNAVSFKTSEASTHHGTQDHATRPPARDTITLQHLAERAMLRCSHFTWHTAPPQERHTSYPTFPPEQPALRCTPTSIIGKLLKPLYGSGSRQQISRLPPRERPRTRGPRAPNERPGRVPVHQPETEHRWGHHLRPLERRRADAALSAGPRLLPRTAGVARRRATFRRRVCDRRSSPEPRSPSSRILHRRSPILRCFPRQPSNSDH